MSTTPEPMVCATCVPAKAPATLNTAPKATALRGDNALVDTTAAMALAASCIPLMYSKIKVVRITARRRERPMSAVLDRDVKNRVRHRVTVIHGALDIAVNAAELD